MRASNAVTERGKRYAGTPFNQRRRSNPCNFAMDGAGASSRRDHRPRALRKARTHRQARARKNCPRGLAFVEGRAKRLMPKREYIVRIPVSLVKSPALSSDAKLLRLFIGAYSDGKTGRSFVSVRTLEKQLRWGRGRRERAQNELVRYGCLHLDWKRNEGRWARRVFQLCDCTVAPSRRSGEVKPLISHYSQVSHQEPQARENCFSGEVT